MSKGTYQVRERPEDGYMKWFRRFPLRPIDSEKDNARALAVLDEMMIIGTDRLTKDEIDYFRGLSLFIQDFEKRNYDLGPYLSPEEMLEELMKEYGLNQKDLEPEMGSQAAVSYVLSGKRRLTVDQIVALANRFKVSPAVFLPKDVPRIAEKKTAARRTASRPVKKRRTS